MPPYDDNVTHEETAKSGHPGLRMGAAEIATALFTKVLKYDASVASWPDRDRFVLSAGHGSMLLYALLYLTGEPSMTIAELQRFRQLGSRTPGHPEYRHAPGVKATTGPLGQGLAMAAGMALAERMLNAEFGSIVGHHSYVLASAGDLMDGISEGAIIGEDGIFIGMTGFGASAPYQDVYKYSTLRRKPSPRPRRGVATVDAR